MRVRMQTTAAGPGGVFLSGSVHDLPDDIAGPWVAGGYAVVIGDEDLPAAVVRRTPETTAPPAAPSEPKSKAIGDMNKAELQALAAALELDTGGTNKELIARIKEHQDASESQGASTEGASASDDGQ